MKSLFTGMLHPVKERMLQAQTALQQQHTHQIHPKFKEIVIAVSKWWSMRHRNGRNSDHVSV